MKILICGAGIAGLTLAFWLRRHGHEVIIVEKAPGLRGEGYMIDFFSSGYEVAERMGILRKLQAIHYPIERLAFLASDGREKFSVSYRALRRLFDDRHFNFMRGDLERVLHDEIAENVSIRFGTSVAELEEFRARKVRAVLSDRSVEVVDLLVGADGLHSEVRRLALGEEQQFLRFLGHHTAAFIIDDPELHRRLAGSFQTLTVPGRQVGLYPIRGGRVATFFVHPAKRVVIDRSREAAVRELREVYGGMGWIVPEILARCGDGSELYFDAVSQVVMRAWCNGRVVLLGDACQCVSLLAGQGASMAMAGAYILAEELEADAGDVPAALVRYERRMMPPIEKKQRAGRNLSRWFVPRGRVHLAVRDLALRISSWPMASFIVKRQLAADSVLE